MKKLIFSLTLLCVLGTLFSQNQISISRQLECSEEEGSIIVTDSLNRQFYLPPGPDGHILGIVDGVPQWVILTTGGMDTNTTYTIGVPVVVGGTKTYVITDSDGNDQIISFTDTDTQRTDLEICAAVAANCNAAFSVNLDGSYTFTDNAGNDFPVSFTDTNTTYEITGPTQDANNLIYTHIGSDGSSETILIPKIQDETGTFIPVILNDNLVGYNYARSGSNGEVFTEGFTFPEQCSLTNLALISSDGSIEIDTVVYENCNVVYDLVATASGGGGATSSIVSSTTSGITTLSHTSGDGSPATDFCPSDVSVIDHHNSTINTNCSPLELHRSLWINDNKIAVSSQDSDDAAISAITNHHLRYSQVSTNATVTGSSSGLIATQNSSITSPVTLGLAGSGLTSSGSGFMLLQGRDVESSLGNLYGIISGEELTGFDNRATFQSGRRIDTDNVDYSIVGGFNYDATDIITSVLAGSSHPNLSNLTGSGVFGSTLNLSSTNNAVFYGFRNEATISSSSSIGGNDNKYSGVTSSFAGGTDNDAENVSGSIVVGTGLTIRQSIFATNSNSVISGGQAGGAGGIYTDIVNSMITGSGLTVTDLGDSFVTSNGGGSIVGQQASFISIGDSSNITQQVSDGISAWNYINGNNINASVSYSMLHGNDITATNLNEIVALNGANGGVLNVVNPHSYNAMYDEYNLWTNPTQTLGLTLGAGSTAWASLSMRAAKENLERVRYEDLYKKFLGIDITTWNYLGQEDKHIGIMADDFYYLAGEEIGAQHDNEKIETIDADGLQMALIKALQNELEGLKLEVKELRNEVAKLK